MLKISKLAFAACILAGSVGFMSQAAADSAGQMEYMENCATCHGAAAMGEGPLAEFMTVNVPDLTTIAQRNDGIFPTLDVIHIIDGRTGVRAHGSDMPIWGSQFMAEAASDSQGDYGPNLVTRGRILSLVYYLESIQK